MTPPLTQNLFIHLTGCSVLICEAYTRMDCIVSRWDFCDPTIPNSSLSLILCFVYELEYS